VLRPPEEQELARRPRRRTDRYPQRHQSWEKSLQLAQRLVPGQKGREQVHLQQRLQNQLAPAPEQLLLVPVPVPVPEGHSQRRQSPEGRVQAQPELEPEPEPEPGPFWVAQQPCAEGPPSPPPR